MDNQYLVISPTMERAQYTFDRAMEYMDGFIAKASRSIPPFIDTIGGESFIFATNADKYTRGRRCTFIKEDQVEATFDDILQNFKLPSNDTSSDGSE